MSVRTDEQSKQPFTWFFFCFFFLVVRLLARIFSHFNAIDESVVDVDVPAAAAAEAAPGPAAVIVAATALT